MNEMHPFRWTYTAFCCFIAFRVLQLRDTEFREWAPVVALGIAGSAVFLAAIDLAIWRFARSASRTQKRLRLVSAGILLICGVTIVLGLVAAAKRNKYELDIPNRPLALPQQPSAGVEADSGTPAAEILNPNL